MLSCTFFLAPPSTPTPQVLLIQGFLACRKHSERIVLMVKMMSKSGLPCFKSGAERTVRALEKRLALNLTEVQVRPVSKGRRRVVGGARICGAHRGNVRDKGAVGSSECKASLVCVPCAMPCPHMQVVQMVLSLISDSLDAWRTRQYDYYQRVMNGIL